MVPIETLAGRDLHQVQLEELRAHAEHRKTLEAKFGSAPDLTTTSCSSSSSEACCSSGPSEAGDVPPSSTEREYISVSATMASLQLEASKSAHPDVGGDAKTPTPEEKRRDTIPESVRTGDGEPDRNAVDERCSTRKDSKNHARRGSVDSAPASPIDRSRMVASPVPESISKPTLPIHYGVICSGCNVRN